MISVSHDVLRGCLLCDAPPGQAHRFDCLGGDHVPKPGYEARRCDSCGENVSAMEQEINDLDYDYYVLRMSQDSDMNNKVLHIYDRPYNVEIGLAAELDRAVLAGATFRLSVDYGDKTGEKTVVYLCTPCEPECDPDGSPAGSTVAESA